MLAALSPAPRAAGAADSTDWGWDCPETSPLFSQAPSPPVLGQGGRWVHALVFGQGCPGSCVLVPFLAAIPGCGNKPAAAVPDVVSACSPFSGARRFWVLSAPPSQRHVPVLVSPVPPTTTDTDASEHSCVSETGYREIGAFYKRNYNKSVAPTSVPPPRQLPAKWGGSAQHWDPPTEGGGRRIYRTVR